MKVRAVQEKDPIKLMNKPNLGTIMPIVAERRTIRVRMISRFVGRKLLSVGILLYRLDDSIISKTGMICKG